MASNPHEEPAKTHGPKLVRGSNPALTLALLIGLLALVVAWIAFLGWGAAKVFSWIS